MNEAIAKEKQLHDEYKVSVGEIDIQKKKGRDATKKMNKANEQYREVSLDLIRELHWMDRIPDAGLSTSDNLGVRSWNLLIEVLAVYLWHIAWEKQLRRLSHCICGQKDYNSISFSEQLILIKRMLALANEIVDVLDEQNSLSEFDWRRYMSYVESEEAAKKLAEARLAKFYSSYNKSASSIKDPMIKSWFVRIEVLAAYLWGRDWEIGVRSFCQPYTEWIYNYYSTGFSKPVKLLGEMHEIASTSK